MKLKTILPLALILMAILTIGAASAADNHTSYLGIDDTPNVVCGVENDNQNVLKDESDDLISKDNDDNVLRDSPLSDLSISLASNSTGTCEIGTTIKLTATVTNSGPNGTEDVNVNLILSSNLNEINHTESVGTYDGYVWSIPALNAGGNATLDILCRAIQTGDTTQTCQVSGLNTDPNLSNNEASAEFTITTKPSFVEIAAADVFRGENLIVNITLPDGATGTVSVIVNGKSMNITATDGKATAIFNTSNMSKKSYGITAKYWGDEYFASSENDTSFNVFSDMMNFYDLQNMINNVSINNVLELDYDYINDDIDSEAGVQITKPMTIDGKGHAIDANHYSYVFRVNSSMVTIKNLRIINGHNVISAGIYAYAHNLVIENCTFANLSSESDGGAIHIEGENATVSQCSFENCSSTTNGGAILLRGETSRVTNSSFTNCTALAGGAVYLEGIDFIMSDNSFMTCHADNDGAALYLRGECINIANSNFTECNGDGNGVIYGDADNVSIESSNFENNTASLQGGAINIQGDNTAIMNSNFVKNRCTFSKNTLGGGIYINGRNSTIIRSNFTENDALEGGAICIKGKNSTIINSSFTSNRANTGAGLSFSGSNLTVYNSTFRENMFLTGSITSSCKGGGIYINGDNECNFIRNCLFEANSANFGSGVYVNNRAQYNSTAILNCTFIQNKGYRSGAVYYTDSTNTLVADCYFGFNSAVKHGGGIYAGQSISSSNFTIYNCTFESNIVTEGLGGAISLRISGSSIIKCTFINNSASHGGSIILKESGVSNVVVDNCTFINSTSFGGSSEEGSGGGAIASWGTDPYNSGKPSTDIIVLNSNFINCRALTFNGGAIVWTSSNGIIENCSFMNCFAPCGGSIGLVSERTILKNLTIINSKSTEYGGAIYMAPITITSSKTIVFNSLVNCTLEDIMIINSTANNGTGGGIYISHDGDNLTFKNVIINNASSKGNGGGMYVESQHTTVMNCLFKETFSNSNGGAIYWNGSYGNMTDSNFNNCSCNGYGGAIDWQGDNGVMANCNVTGCCAKMSGGGVSWNGTNGTCIGCNFTDCTSSSEASAVYWQGIGGSIENSTFNQAKGDDCHAVYASQNLSISNSVFRPPVGKTMEDALYGATAQNCDVIETPKQVPEIMIDIEDIELGENATVNITLPSDVTNNVTITLYRGGEKLDGIQIIPSDGHTSRKYSNLRIGEYLLYIQYPGDDEYENITCNVTFIVRPNVIIPEKVPANTNLNIFMKFGQNITDTIIVKINGRTFDVLNIKEGIVNDTTKKMQHDIGNYTITFAYEGDEFNERVLMYFDNATDSYLPREYDLQIIPEEILLPEEIDTKDDGIVYIEVPINATGNLTIFVDGEVVGVLDVEKEIEKFLNETNGNVYDIVMGILKIDLSKYGGKHVITFEYSGDDTYHAFTKESNVTVNINYAIISASNVKVLYTACPQYTIKVYESEGIVAADVKVVVKSNGKSYKTLTTNSKGVASFKIKKVPGTYKLTITALGKNVTKTMTVKHIVNLKTVKVKRSAKKLILTATLSKVNKKYLKNKKVTFKFNGKKYTAKTNKKGVAKVTIKSSVLKKLKVGKKVTYQATYLKDTVKKTVKITK